MEAEYVNSTADTVTIKRADGQALRLLLSECSQEDRDFVAEKQAAQIAANSIDATVSGKIIWKLPPWRNLSWSTRQNSELWSYDDKTGKPAEKIVDLPVSYESDFRRSEFSGEFSTAGPVRLLKTGRFIIKGIFHGSVNGEDKSVEQLSAPFSLPQISKGVIDLHTVRFTKLK